MPLLKTRSNRRPGLTVHRFTFGVTERDMDRLERLRTRLAEGRYRKLPPSGAEIVSMALAELDNKFSTNR